MNEQIDSYKHQIEKLEGEVVELLRLNTWPIQPATSIDPLKELSKTFFDLNIVEV